MEAGFKMSSLSPRTKRVLDAISDPSSYRLLWYSLTDRPIPLEGIEAARGYARNGRCVGRSNGRRQRFRTLDSQCGDGVKGRSGFLAAGHCVRERATR